MMKSYGQFCSIAKALEIVGERWTPLILREMMCGSARFSEIHRGIPKMSPALLAKRLTHLETAGVVHKVAETGNYKLTDAGWELKPMVEALGVWGQRWVRGQLSDAELDPDLLMWDIRRRMNIAAMPKGRICLRFKFADVAEDTALYWLVKSYEGIDLCITDPGYVVDLYISTDVRTMTEIWNGDTPISAAIDRGEIDLHGASALRNAFPAWLQLNQFAGVRPAEA